MATTLFEASHSHSKILLLEGEPQYLEFVIHNQDNPDSQPNTYVMPLSDFLEIYMLSNAVWFGQIWSQLEICIAGFCENLPKGCHVRKETCPTLTEFEKRNFNDYNRRMRELHMEEKRSPIPDGTTSNSSLESF